MRSVDQPESYAPLGAPIRPEPTKPTAPRPEGPSGVVTINGKAQTTSHPKPPMRNYSDILDTQGMVHRDSFPPNSLKWVGEAADKWRQEQVMADPILVVKKEGTLSYAAGKLMIDSWHFETVNQSPTTRPANGRDVLRGVMDFIDATVFVNGESKVIPTAPQSAMDESGMPMLAGFATSFIPPAGMNDEYTERDMGRKADRD